VLMSLSLNPPSCQHEDDLYGAGMMDTTAAPVVPFNPCNVLATLEDVRELLQRYMPESQWTKCGLAEPTRLDLYQNALTHRSYASRGGGSSSSSSSSNSNSNSNSNNNSWGKCPPDMVPLQPQSNERLEFLGDAVLNIVVAGYLYERYPAGDEGFMTRIRTKLVNGVMLASLCKTATTLPRLLLISQQVETGVGGVEGGGRSSRHALEDVFEAFLAALYLDRGFDAARMWLVGLLEQHVDFAQLVAGQNSAKDVLHRQFMRVYGGPPRYEMIANSMPGGAPGPPGKSSHLPSHISNGCMRSAPTVSVVIKNRDGAVMGAGRGTDKREAECDAARNTLARHGWGGSVL
jgi:dsRNA-specific ribonuclease